MDPRAGPTRRLPLPPAGPGLAQDRPRTGPAAPADEAPTFEPAADSKWIQVRSRPLGIETGELTPTLKVKRNKVSVAFASQIDAMYEGASE